MEIIAAKDGTGNKLWMVYQEDDFAGHVEVVRGGWVFFNSNGDVTATHTTLEGAVQLGVNNG